MLKTSNTWATELSGLACKVELVAIQIIKFIAEENDPYGKSMMFLKIYETSKKRKAGNTSLNTSKQSQHT